MVRSDAGSVRVVGLESLGSPEVLELEDDGLERGFLCHVGYFDLAQYRFSISDLRFWIGGRVAVQRRIETSARGL